MDMTAQTAAIQSTNSVFAKLIIFCFMIKFSNLSPRRMPRGVHIVPHKTAKRNPSTIANAKAQGPLSFARATSRTNRLACSLGDRRGSAQNSSDEFCVFIGVELQGGKFNIPEGQGGHNCLFLSPGDLQSGISASRVLCEVAGNGGAQSLLRSHSRQSGPNSENSCPPVIRIEP